MPNRLAQESSPYLRQHMHNPVDWYPWGDEALARAKAEDKPILLSVGYAACHWCHVMEHESFEDPDVAKLMNQRFVSIKVDREERPDIDHIYMTACQLFTGSGGWPLTVFLTPDLRPYFAGTYFPKDDKYGRPGFKRILVALSDAYHSQRDDVVEQASRFHEALQGLASGPSRKEGAALSAEIVMRSANVLLRRVDGVNGGFGDRPKFPNTLDLLVLEAAARRGMDNAGRAALLTCLRMAEGGIHDHLGGGFHRYSVDEKWLVPHFEKMLYDNALIPRVFLAVYRREGLPFLANVVEDTLAYVAREMTHPEGAFYATQDADSEGEEGRFFVWTPAEVKAVLGDDDGKAFCLRFGVVEGGNFEHGKSVLHLARGVDEVARTMGLSVDEMHVRLEASKERLFEAREKRVKPARDEKILAGWNGLMASAFCDAASTLDRPEHLQSAVKALTFIMTKMRTPDGGLFRVFHGEAKIPGFLEDYAFVARALCDAYRAGGGEQMLRHAEALCEQMVARFYDATDPGFFSTEKDAPGLLVRARSGHDEAVPAGGSVAASALLDVGTLTGKKAWVELVEKILERHSGELAQRPTAYSTLTLLLDSVVRGMPMIVVHGDDAMVQMARRVSDVMVVSTRDAVDPALLDGKRDKPGAYVCANQTCQAPVTDEAGLRDALGRSALVASAARR